MTGFAFMDGRHKGRPWPSLRESGPARKLEAAFLSGVQPKKKPRPTARQFIREETPRKGRGVSDASQLQSRVRRTIDQAENAPIFGKKARHDHFSGIINALMLRLRYMS